jgi:hypothetical protein
MMAIYRSMNNLLRAVPKQKYIKEAPAEVVSRLTELFRNPEYDVKRLTPKSVYWEGAISKKEREIAGSTPSHMLYQAFLDGTIPTLAEELERRYDIVYKKPIRVQRAFDDSKMNESDMELQEYKSEIEEPYMERGQPLVPRPPDAPRRGQRPGRGVSPIPRQQGVRPPPLGRPSVPQGRLRPQDIQSFPQTLPGQVARTRALSRSRQRRAMAREADRQQEEDNDRLVRDFMEQEGEGKPKRKKGGHVHKRDDFQDEAELEPYLTKHLRPSKYRKNVPPIESSSEESSGLEEEESDMEINEMRLGKGKKKMSKKQMKALENLKAMRKMDAPELAATISKHKKGGARRIKPVEPVIKDSGADKDLWFM